MKRVIWILCMVCTTFWGYGQRKIKKLEVAEVGINVKLNFQPVNDQVSYSGLNIKITPISADDLNSKFFSESGLNGLFEYSYYENARNSYFLRKGKRKRVKSDYELLLEGVAWLLDNEKISDQEYEELEKQIELEYDATLEKEILIDDRIVLSNPFYIGANRYLNVFKIEISNPTDSYLTFNNGISIENGNSLLKPLSTEQITTELERADLINTHKILTLERYNLPKIISVPPKSIVEKYFAIPPLDYNNSDLIISNSPVNRKFNWNVIKDIKHINERYTFYELKIDWSYAISHSYGFNFNLITGKSSTVFLNDNKLYIQEDHLSREVEMFTLALYNDKLYYGRNSIRGTDFVQLDKNRRRVIQFQTEKIEDIKKKVRQ